MTAQHPKSSTPTKYAVFSLVPESLVPEKALVVGKVVVGDVHGVVEANLVALGVVVGVVLGPEELVVGPLGVGVARQNERQEVLLHLDLYAIPVSAHPLLCSM